MWGTFSIQSPVVYTSFLLFSRCPFNSEFNFIIKLLLRLSASGLHSNPAHVLSVALSCFSCWGESPRFPLPSSCASPVKGEALLVQKSRWFGRFSSLFRWSVVMWGMQPFRDAEHSLLIRALYSSRCRQQWSRIKRHCKMFVLKQFAVVCQLCTVTLPCCNNIWLFVELWFTLLIKLLLLIAWLDFLNQFITP